MGITPRLAFHCAVRYRSDVVLLTILLMMRKRVVTTLVVVWVIALSGCDKGLAPLNEISGFKGVIYYKNWPPADSTLELRVVAFKDYPADSSGILEALLSGRAVVYPQVTEGVDRANMTLGRFKDTVHYDFLSAGTTLRIGTYNYVVLAWRFGPNYLADWRPAGVYSGTPNSFQPAPVKVYEYKTTPDIDMYVDFDNLPPKPWK